MLAYRSRLARRRLVIEQGFFHCCHPFDYSQDVEERPLLDQASAAAFPVLTACPVLIEAGAHVGWRTGGKCGRSHETLLALRIEDIHLGNPQLRRISNSIYVFCLNYHTLY